jgi:hypothetical protein
MGITLLSGLMSSPSFHRSENEADTASSKKRKPWERTKASRKEKTGVIGRKRPILIKKKGRFPSMETPFRLIGSDRLIQGFGFGVEFLSFLKIYRATIAILVADTQGKDRP